MYAIDKNRFGAFVAERRREKGLTQRELAARLYLSDKAVSKWETGASLPDTALLVPLAELLGVTVTELLLCRLLEQSQPMDAEQVEGLVKRAIAYPEEPEPRRVEPKWLLSYLAALLLGGAELWLLQRSGGLSEALWLCVLLAALFGAYFCLFARRRLPGYHDEYRISQFSDGIVRMNVPGLSFNNRNWPHILTAVRLWALLSMTLLPLLSLAGSRLAPALWARAQFAVVTVPFLVGLFLPMYVVGKKHE